MPVCFPYSSPFLSARHHRALVVEQKIIPLGCSQLRGKSIAPVKRLVRPVGPLLRAPRIAMARPEPNEFPLQADLPIEVPEPEQLPLLVDLIEQENATEQKHDDDDCHHETDQEADCPQTLFHGILQKISRSSPTRFRDARLLSRPAKSKIH